MKVFYYENNTKYFYDGSEYFESESTKDTGYKLWKEYEASNKGLKEFYDHLEDESKKFKKLAKESYIQGFTPNKFQNLDSFIYNLCLKKSTIQDLDNVPINEEEEEIKNLCYNAGLMFHNKEDTIYKNVKAYDFSNYYCSIVGNPKMKNKIPINNGTYKTIEELPDKLEFGMYHVRIISNHPNVKKCFAFSADNVYTHIDINIARFLKKNGIIDNIQLIKKENNAYIYKEEDLIIINKVFKNYYHTIIRWRKKYPKSRFLKLVSSQLYTRLHKKVVVRKIYFKDIEKEENQEYKILGLDLDKKTNEIICNCVKTTAPQKRSLRVYPWIPAYARQKLFSYVLSKSNLDNVLRVYIDGVIFKEEPKFKLPANFNKESKYYNKDVQFIKQSQVKILN